MLFAGISPGIQFETDYSFEILRHWNNTKVQWSIFHVGLEAKRLSCQVISASNEYRHRIPPILTPRLSKFSHPLITYQAAILDYVIIRTKRKSL